MGNFVEFTKEHLQELHRSQSQYKVGLSRLIDSNRFQ